MDQIHVTRKQSFGRFGEQTARWVAEKLNGELWKVNFTADHTAPTEWYGFGVSDILDHIKIKGDEWASAMNFFLHGVGK